MFHPLSYVQMDDNASITSRLTNLGATQFTYLAAVVSFYGTWKTQDNYFDEESEDNDSGEEGDIDEDMMDID